jgi:hypothetical protein
MTVAWVLILWWGNAAFKVGEYPTKEECLDAVYQTVGNLGSTRLGFHSCTPVPRREWRTPPDANYQSNESPRGPR